MGMGIATLFGQHGYRIGLVSRNPAKLAGLLAQLTAQGIEVHTQAADAANLDELTQAITALQTQLGPVSALVYNAAAMRAQDIMNETAETLIQDFRLNVAGALQSV